MGFKTILVYCDVSKTAASRLHVALDLAGRFDAHVIGLHVRRRFEAPRFTGATMALDALYRTYETAAQAEERAAAKAFHDAVGGKGYSSEWRVVDGLAEDALIGHARFADLIVQEVARTLVEPTLEGIKDELNCLDLMKYVEGYLPE